MELASEINNFRGHYGFLSNFYRQYFIWSGQSVPTAEHAFQAEKTLVPAERAAILGAVSPRNAKAMGRTCTKRPDWETIRVDVMRRVLRAKFARGTDLAYRLDATGNRTLVEGNTWGDVFWGVCGGAGENWLGTLLMEIRDENRVIAAGPVRP